MSISASIYNVPSSLDQLAARPTQIMLERQRPQGD